MTQTGTYNENKNPETFADPSLAAPQIEREAALDSTNLSAAPEPLAIAAEKVADDSETASTIAADIPAPEQSMPTLPDFGQQQLEQKRCLNAYLAAVVLVNVCLLFLKGYDADLGYWQDWVRQLSSNGYDNFNGNYPPFYVHWLYIVGQIYNHLNVPLEHNNFLKLLTQLPVVFSHCIFTGMIFTLLQRVKAERTFLHLFMLLTVVNPALLLNGPIWGQVDLIPATITVGALFLCLSQRFVYLAIPMFTLALLTKFQMIAFAPVFGFLFFRDIKQHLLGMLIAIAVCIVVFLPSILAGHLQQAFKQAYIDTLGQYPMTTFNGANLWILLTGNTAPDSQLLFGVSADSWLAKPFTAKYFGMLLFALTALWVFIRGVWQVALNKVENDTQTLTSFTFFSAMLCSIAFFTLLPAMHERYLFPAIVLSLVYSASAQSRLIYPLGLSLLCALNMLIILEINGSDIWEGLAWGMVIVFGYALLESLIGKKFSAGVKALFNQLYRLPYLWLWVFVLTSGSVFLTLYERYRIHDLTLAENQIFLTNLHRTYAKQDHGTLHNDSSFDNNRLSLNKKRYKYGIGTHANSDIQFLLPENAIEFSFMAGLDGEVGTADVQFSVWGDDKKLWESKVYYNSEDGELVTLNIEGIKHLNLKVDAVKSDKWDHADWINPVVTFRKTEQQ